MFDSETQEKQTVSGVNIGMTSDELTEPGRIEKELTKHGKVVPGWFDFKDYLNSLTDKEEKED
jgi:hypothetical protein